MEDSRSMTDKIIKEIDAINAQARKMALAVLDDSAMRATYGAKAQHLCDHLLELADELKKSGPEKYKKQSHAISESILDLVYATRDVNKVSLRLGRAIRS